MNPGQEDEVFTIKNVFGYKEILWEIENFLPSTCKKNWVIESPEFTVEGPRLTKWRFLLKAKHLKKRYLVETQLERLLCDSFAGPVQVNWRLCYPCGGGNQLISESCKTFDINTSFPVEIDDIGLVETRLIFSERNTFIVQCSMFVYTPGNTAILERSKDIGLKSLSQDMTVLFKLMQNEDPPFEFAPDILFKIGLKEQLPVHRAVVSSRNEVMKDLIEKQGKTVRFDYPNINLEITEKIIGYLYTGDLKYILRKPSFGVEKAIKYFNINTLKKYFYPDELTLKTKFSTQEFKFIWIIDVPNMENKDLIHSPPMNLGREVFQFLLYPNGIGNGKSKMSIFIQFLDQMEIQDLCLQLAVMDKFEGCRHVKCLRWSSEYGETLGFEDFVSTSVLHSPFYICQNKFKIVCEFQIPTGFNNNLVVRSKTCSPMHLEKDEHLDLLSKQMASLSKTGDYSDLTIECGVLRFRVHKGIICCRSHVLKEMISKTKTTSVSLSDLDPIILSKIINFLYSGRVEEQSANEILDIYDKANSWALLTLKYLCSQLLEERLKVENVLRILMTAHTYNDLKLKVTAFRFICDNLKEVESQPSWELLTGDTSGLHREYVAFKNTYERKLGTHMIA